MGSQVLARGADHLVCVDDSGRVTVLAWQPVGGSDGPSAPDRHEVHLSIPVSGGDGVAVLRERVNEDDGNAFTAWRELGRPMSPTERELAILRRAERPAFTHSRATVVDGRVDLHLELGRHEVTFVELLPVRETHHEGRDDRRLLGGSDETLLLPHEK